MRIQPEKMPTRAPWRNILAVAIAAAVGVEAAVGLPTGSIIRRAALPGAGSTRPGAETRHPTTAPASPPTLPLLALYGYC